MVKVQRSFKKHSPNDLKKHKQNNYCFIKLCDSFQANLRIPRGSTPDFKLGLAVLQPTGKYSWAPYTKSCHSEIQSLMHKDIFLNMMSG